MSVFLAICIVAAVSVLLGMELQHHYNFREQCIVFVGYADDFVNRIVTFFRTGKFVFITQIKQLIKKDNFTPYKWVLVLFFWVFTIVILFCILFAVEYSSISRRVHENKEEQNSANFIKVQAKSSTLIYLRDSKEGPWFVISGGYENKITSTYLVYVNYDNSLTFLPLNPKTKSM